MKLRWPSLFLMLGAVSMLLVVPATTFAQGVGQGAGQNQAPGQNKGMVAHLTGKAVPKAGGDQQDVTGDFNITNFENDNGCIMAVGHLRLKPANAAVIDQDGVKMPLSKINDTPIGNCATSAGSTDQSAATTSDDGATDLSIAQTGTCSILNLVLGPLHLDLLGLVIDLNQVVLNITAQQGPGNLLGNLLCGIAGLLDTTGTTGVLTNLLNALLAALQL